jgi:hypothetical protein
MKKTSFLNAALLLVLVMLSCVLSAQKLPLDLNGRAMQLPKYFTAVSDTIVKKSPTLHDSLAVPANAVEVDLIFRDQPGFVSFAKDIQTSPNWIYVPKNVPFRLPVMSTPSPYMKYRSFTTANHLTVIWRRM